MASARSLVSAAIAAVLMVAAAPRPADAQACARVPRADAGTDVQACVPAVGTTDYLLSASRSLSQPLNGPIVQYCWRTDYGTFTSTGTDAACAGGTDVTLRVPNTPGRTIITAVVTVTDSAGCTDDDAIVLDLATAPVITRAEAATAEICLGQPIDLLASAVNTFAVSGLVEYRWDRDISLDRDANGFPDDDPDAVLTGVSGRLVVASTVPQRPGRYTARLTVITAGDPCTATADVDYLVQDPPVVRLLVGPSLTCPNQEGRFQAELAFGDAGSDLTWDFDTSIDADGDGDPANDVEASGNQASHSWPDSGTRTVRVTAVGTNGCEGFTEKDTIVRTAPVPAFTTSGPGCGPLAVTFTDLSTGSGELTVSWDFGDGSVVESGTSRTHLYPAPGAYRVSHVVTDVEGCITSESRIVQVVPASAVAEGVTILDGQAGTDTVGNADGFADPGERIRLVVDVLNAGPSAATDLTATLATTDDQGRLILTDATAQVQSLAPGERGTTLSPHLQAEIAASAPCGTSIPATIAVTGASAGSCAATLPISLRVGAPELAPTGGELTVTQSNGQADVADSVHAAGSHALLVLDSTSGPTRARVVRLSSTGLPQGESVLVDDAGSDVVTGQIAWSAEEGVHAVAWVGVEGTTPPGGNLVARMRRLGASGSPLGPSRRLDLAGFAGTIDLAWAGDHWVAAWTDRATAGAPAQLVAQVITSEGLLLGAPVPLGSAGTDDGAVRVAASGDRVLVAHRSGTELRLFTLEGMRPAVVTRQDTLSGATGIPSVIRWGAGFLAAFESGAGIDLAWMPSAGSITRSTAVAAGRSPALGSGAGLGALAWMEAGAIRARLVGTSGAASDAVTASVSDDPARAPALSATSEGLFLASWSAAVGAGNVIVRAGLLVEAAADGCASGVPGDVAPRPDGDGRVDVADVVLVLRAAVGLTEVTPELLARGDVAPGERVGSEHRVEGDDRIDVADAVVLLQASTGIVTIVP